MLIPNLVSPSPPLMVAELFGNWCGCGLLKIREKEMERKCFVCVKRLETQPNALGLRISLCFRFGLGVTCRKNVGGTLSMYCMMASYGLTLPKKKRRGSGWMVPCSRA